MALVSDAAINVCHGLCLSLSRFSPCTSCFSVGTVCSSMPLELMHAMLLEVRVQL